MKCSKWHYAFFAFILFLQIAFGFEAVLGEEVNRQLTIHNPAISLTDTLNVEITTQGSINAYFTDTFENHRRFDIRPQKDVTLPITVIGSFCTEQQCEGKLIVYVNSEKTDNEVTKEFLFEVLPSQSEEYIGSAPGISFFQFILIGLVGAGVLFFGNRFFLQRSI